jgi:aldose 1-epimerase
MKSLCRTPFGSLPDRTINEFKLRNSNGMEARILDYGGIITQLHVPGRRGLEDIVLGFDNPAEYLRNPCFFGAIIGRVTNRIAGARFTLDGKTSQLDANEPPNHLHGGFQAFHKQHWLAEAYADRGDCCLRLQRRSPDGECGYPGGLDTVVIYRLTEDNTLHFSIAANTDQPTPVSISQHSYFNLAGHNAGDIGSHRLQLAAETVTEVDDHLLPTGRLLPVAGTPFDFTIPTAIGARQQALAGSYDINYVVKKADTGIVLPAARLYEPVSGRVLTISTTKPGMQFYDGSHLASTRLRGKGNTVYGRCAGLCLEPQHFPDAINHPEFPSPVLRPGECYEHTTIFSFGIAAPETEPTMI